MIYSRDELIEIWLEMWPQDKYHEDLEFNAVAGYVEVTRYPEENGFVPYKEWLADKESKKS